MYLIMLLMILFVCCQNANIMYIYSQRSFWNRPILKYLGNISTVLFLNQMLLGEKGLQAMIFITAEATETLQKKLVWLQTSGNGFDKWVKIWGNLEMFKELLDEVVDGYWYKRYEECKLLLEMRTS